MPRRLSRSSATADAGGDDVDARATKLLRDVRSLYLRLPATLRRGPAAAVSKADYFKNFSGDGRCSWDVEALEEDARILRRRLRDASLDEENDGMSTAAAANSRRSGVAAAKPKRALRPRRAHDDAEAEADDAGDNGSFVDDEAAEASPAARPSRIPPRTSSRLRRSRASTGAQPAKALVRRSANNRRAPAPTFSLQDSVTAMLGGELAAATAPAPARKKAVPAAAKGRRVKAKAPRSTTKSSSSSSSSSRGGGGGGGAAPVGKRSRRRRHAASSEEENDDDDDESTRGAENDADPNMDLSRLGGVHSDVLREFEFLRTLGSEGKDGQTFLCRARTAAQLADGTRRTKGSLAAMKVFKKQKSVSFIRKEVALQRQVAELGVAPPVVSTWKVDERHRCFAMKALDRTLLQLLKDQKGELTSAQQRQVVALFDKLGDEGGIFHNDSNIARNMMVDDTDGRLYLIDFGMSKPIDKALTKRFGPNPNYSLLVRVNRFAMEINKTQKPYFEALIDQYEKDNGVVVDLHRAQHAARQKATQAALLRIRSRGVK